jgi:hypothetical protein
MNLPRVNFQKLLDPDDLLIHSFRKSIYGFFSACIFDPFTLYDTGVNWLQTGHRSKFSLDYQSRPILAQGTTEKLIKNSAEPRKGMLVMQYQFAF